MNENTWTLWGDGAEPVAEGTEEEVKQAYFESSDPNQLYIQAPNGEEWEWNGAEWIETS